MHASDLDPTLSARVEYASAWHPVLAVRKRAGLAYLDYDFAVLGGTHGAPGPDNGVARLAGVGGSR